MLSKRYICGNVLALCLQYTLVSAKLIKNVAAVQKLAEQVRVFWEDLSRGGLVGRDVTTLLTIIGLLYRILNGLHSPYSMHRHGTTEIEVVTRGSPTPESCTILCQRIR